MKKIILITILFFMLTLSVNGLEICADIIPINSQCRIVTPTLSCNNYTYIVLNNTGDVIENDTLTNFNDNIYEFNFTPQQQGELIIKLCDDTTREIFIKDEDSNMAWLAIVFSLGIMTALFAFMGYSIKNESLLSVKLLMFGLAMFNIFFMGFMPFIISNNSQNVAAFVPVGIAYVSVNGIAFVYFIWSYGIHLFLNIFKTDSKIDKM